VDEIVRRLSIRESHLFIADKWRYRLGSEENRGFYELHLTSPVFYPPFLGYWKSSPSLVDYKWTTTYFLCTRPLLLGSVRAGTLRYSAVQLFSKYSNPCENHTDGQTTCNLITPLCVASRGNKRHIYIYLIFLETTITGLHFTADNIGLSSLKFFGGFRNFVYFGERDVSAVQGHPRSLRLVPIESAYATSY